MPLIYVPRAAKLFQLCEIPSETEPSETVTATISEESGTESRMGSVVPGQTPLASSLHSRSQTNMQAHSRSEWEFLSRRKSIAHFKRMTRRNGLTSTPHLLNFTRRNVLTFLISNSWNF